MVIDITNTCLMGCPHCMQRSTPEPQHMDEATFVRTFEFVKWLKPKVILIGGGEPTAHPRWNEIVEAFALGGFLSVNLLTNGMWLGTNAENEVVRLLKCYPQIKVQVTSVSGLYRLHDRTCAEIDRFKKLLKANGLKHRIAFENRIESMVELGRACDSPDIAQVARSAEGTTSCFQGALVASQCTLGNAVDTMECRGKFCRPLVDWKGGIHWSESWLCPAFATVFDEFPEIDRKSHEWRPCGKCAGYKKLLAKTEDKYRFAKFMLGIRERA